MAVSGRGVIQRARLQGDDPFVDELKLAITSRAPQRTGIPDFIARREQRDRLANRFYDANRIPAQHARGIAGKSGADFGIHRIHGNRLHFNEQVMPCSNRNRQLDGA